MKTTIVVTILVFVNTVILFGQEETQKQDTTYTTFEFTLKDDTKLIGQLIDQNKEFYVIKTANFGTMKVGVAQVVSIVLQGQKIETILPKDKSTIYYVNTIFQSSSSFVSFKSNIQCYAPLAPTQIQPFPLRVSATVLYSLVRCYSHAK